MQFDRVNFRKFIDFLRDVFVRKLYGRKCLDEYSRSQNQQLRMLLVSLMIVNIKLEIRKYHVARFVESFGSLPQERLTNPRILKLDGDLEAIGKSDALSLGKFIAKVAHLFFVSLHGFPLLP